MIKRWFARRSARLVVLVLVVGGVAAGVAYATGSIGGGGVIQGCYDTGGNLKVIASGALCPHGYTALAWSQTGPAGKDGTNGTNGTNGKDGINGTNGTPGTPGTPGTQGLPGKDGAPGSDGKDGADGVSVTSATEPAGDNCATGGTKLTAANNNITYACNGAKGDAGTNGTNGTNGAPGTVPAGTCEAGSYVTGFNSSGAMICGCPLSATWMAFDITASEFTGFQVQFWPDEPIKATDPHNAACSVTVHSPSTTPRADGSTFAGSIGGNGPDGNDGWRFVSSTGYPAGQTLTIHVAVPDCETDGGVGSVVNDYPLCSNASTTLENGESHSHVTVTSP